jgi:hypothetical protein
MQFAQSVLISCSILFFFMKSNAQKKETELFITASANIYFPGKESRKSMFPVIGYNKNTNPRFLLGGFGLAVTALKPIEKKLYSKMQTGLFRHTYWNEFVQAFDFAGNDLNTGRNSTVNYNIDLFGTIHYRIAGKFSAGAGAGVQALLASVSRNPFAGITFGGVTERERVYLNRYYKKLMPFIPLEISFKTKKLFCNIRYEAALLNKVKGDLSNYEQERYGLLNFEFAYRIN